MNDEQIAEIEAFISEREVYFRDKVFPVIHKIALAALKSKKLTQHAFKNYGMLTFRFKHNGVKVIINGYDIGYMGRSYQASVRYKFKEVLRYYCSIADNYSDLKKFHECEWIDKLDGLSAKIAAEDIKWQKRQAESKYAKKCKDFKSFCNGVESNE